MTSTPPTSTLFGRPSLHARVQAFPSAVDKEHFSAARQAKLDPTDMASIPTPRIGFYGNGMSCDRTHWERAVLMADALADKAPLMLAPAYRVVSDQLSGSPA